MKYNRHRTINRYLWISAVFIWALLIFVGIGILLLQDKSKPPLYLLKDGDLIFQTSKSSQSRAIQLATNSVYSHMGMVYKKNADWYVFEAVQTVRLTPLEEWIQRGKGKHFVVKRLKNAVKILTPEKLAVMKNIGKGFIGKNYDIYFSWSDKSMYCSELVWKIFYRALNIKIGELQHLKDFNLTDPSVRDKLIERYGNKVPYDELVISPKAMFSSDLLKEIMRE